MNISRRRLLHTALQTTLLAGCGARLKHFPFDTGQPDPGDSRLRIDFYGVACFQFSWAGCSVLLDPFFSRHPARKSLFGKIGPDPKQVDPYLDRLKTVDTVLVGHGHFDHMLDLPYLATRLAPNPMVLASRTLQHSLAPLGLPLRWKIANPIAATPETPGIWVYNPSRTLRFMPIVSSHAKHLGPFHLYNRQLHQDRKSPPIRASHHQEGQPYAFLMDTLRKDNSIAHRIYIQTSTAGYPSGTFPRALLKNRGVDVAVVSMDTCKAVARSKPSILDFVDPNEVFFGHWDNFFKIKSDTPHEVPKSNLNKLYKYYQGANDRIYRFPAMDSTHFIQSKSS